MMRRCYDPTNKRWAEYGGRGIHVCDAWHDLRQFVADMDDGYQPGLEIDRANNNRGYEPYNCRWATHEEQARNKRNSIHITISGKTKTAAEWARENNIAYGTVWERIKVLGWNPIDAVTTPALDANARCALARDARRYGP